MRVERVEPGDDLWPAWYEAYRSAVLHDRPDASPYAEGEMRVILGRPTSGDETLAFAGVENGLVVATMTANVTLKDNTDQIFAEVNVRPDALEGTAGDRMLEHLETLAGASGRRLVTVETYYPLDAPEDGRGTQPADLLVARGYRFCLGSLARKLALPLDAAFLAALRAEAEPHHVGYTFLQFVGPTPDDLVDEIGRLVGSIAIEAPLGDLELEAEVFDAERIREVERNLEAMRRRRYTTVALDPQGHPVAHTDLVVASLDAGKVYQWGTIVDPRHRGHRLGMAVKVRNLELLQAAEPDVSQITTHNAGSNAHMVAINDRLGFRPVERAGEFQKRL